MNKRFAAIILLLLPVIVFGQISGPLPPVFQQFGQNSVQVAPGLYARTNPAAGDTAYQHCLDTGGTNFTCYPIKVNAIGAEAQNRITSIFGAFFDWLKAEHLYYNAPNGKCYGECPMGYAIVAHVAGSSAGGPGFTTSAIDTSGANLIVVFLTDYNPSSTTLSDSKSNTWIPLTPVNDGSQSRSQFYYCYNPTVGAGHTFTASNSGGSYPAMSVAAWSGATSSPFDVENGVGNSSAISSLQPGSVSPGSANELVITGLGGITQGTMSIDPGFTIGFTITDQFAYNGLAFGCSMAYIIQTTATAENPTWSWNGGAAEATAVIATFKSSGGGGGFVAINRRTIGPRVGSRSSY